MSSSGVKILKFDRKLTKNGEEAKSSSLEKSHVSTVYSINFICQIEWRAWGRIATESLVSKKFQKMLEIDNFSLKRGFPFLDTFDNHGSIVIIIHICVTFV